ncbi:MAG: hypothetical protein ACREM1_13380 [Longimicrobiales bacterium]
MDDRVRRELRMLKAYAVIMTVLFGAFMVAAFRQAEQKQQFGEIDVERINVIEPDGKLRMVISNRERSIGPIYKGRPFGYEGGTRPGIIFFNDEGTENGGLTFHGHQRPDGTFEAGHHLSFDQFNQDQIVVLNYTDDNGQRNMGLTISDRADVDIYDLVAERDSIMQMPESPERVQALERWAAPRDGVPLAARRVYVGRDRSKAAVVDLADPMGNTRIRMRVDSLGTPSLEFLDAEGRVTARLPEPGGA